MEFTVDEVAVRETGFPGDHVAVDPVAPEVTVVMVVGSSEEVVGAS